MPAAIDPEYKRDRWIHIRVKRDTQTKVKDIAQIYACSVSELVNNLIETLIKENEN